MVKLAKMQDPDGEYTSESLHDAWSALSGPDEFHGLSWEEFPLYKQRKSKEKKTSQKRLIQFVSRDVQQVTKILK
jgi:hypothetical protein